MNFDDIEIFVYLVECKSFTQTAKKLSMPTSTVSSRIARLEEKLQTSLVLRTTRKIAITEKGHQFYEHCVTAINALKAGEDALVGDKQEPKGQLNITAPTDIAQSILVPLIASFTKQYPDVKIDLFITNRKVDLIDENIDLAIRIGNLQDSALIASKFFETKVQIWASKNYLASHKLPNDINDLAELDWIVMKNMPKKLILKDQSKKHVELEYEGQLKTNDMLIAKSYVENDCGIALLPDFMIDQEQSDLVKILPQYQAEPTNAYFIYPKQHKLPHLVRLFIDFAKHQLI